MSLFNFNSNNKSWKMYTNTITSISNDDLLIRPNNSNDLILEVSANNHIIISKKGDISYSLNTKVTSIDISFGNVYTTYSAITTSFSDINTKFLLIDASFNSKLASISGNIVPLNDICYNLGSETKTWANAYIRDISVTNISASGNILPLLNLSGSLGVSGTIWANAFIKDISGLDSINGLPYGSGSGTGTIDLSNVTTNINPSIDNSGSLGISGRSWRNAFIRDLSVSSIDVSVNINPLITNNGSLGDPISSYTYTYDATPLSWHNHKIRAQTVPNRYLAAILNAEDNIRATALIGSNQTWIGGRRKTGSVATERTSLAWYWDTGEPWVYYNWDTNVNDPQPNLTSETAVRIHSGGLWHDHNPTSTNTGPALYMTYTSNKRWGNAFICDLSVNSIDVNANINPISIMSGDGGSVTRTNEYVYHVFTTTGSSTFTALRNGTIEVLLVGGGGGGGSSLGSGGGGGGVIWLPSVSVSAGKNYNIVVGAGGAANTNGGTTTCFDASAAGGGRGVGFQTIPGFGISGGSGSGAVMTENQNTIRYTGGGGKVGNSLGSNIGGFSYGERGGNIISNRTGTDPMRQAGGGGAFAQGFDTTTLATGTTTQTGQSSGGQGILNTIYLGLSYYWGGGGGGAAYTANSSVNMQGGWGGLGGGGGGSTSNIASSLGGIGGGSALNSGSNGSPSTGFGGAGGANTGGGGGGGAWFNFPGGAGGSGIVIIRYLSYANVSLGVSNKLWRNAFIRDASVNSIDASYVKIQNFFDLYFPTTEPSRPLKLRIINTSSYSTVDNFGLQVINTTSAINNWSAINVEVKSVTGSVNKAGIKLSVRGSNGVARNVWNIFCRDNDSALSFLRNTNFNAMTGTATTAYISSAGVYNPPSDDRLKHNEIIINNGLTVIDQLVPKVYQKTQVMLDANYNGDLSGYTWSYEAGLIAQEVLQINDISFAVSGGDYYDSSNNLIPSTYSLGYNHIFVYGLAAIKELDKKVRTQELSILSLETNILSQETTLFNQQTIINSLITEIEVLENKV